VPKGIEVVLQSENGMLGVGPYPLESESTPISSTPEKKPSPTSAAAIFLPPILRHDSGGHVDLTFSARCKSRKKGNLANWAIPGKMLKGMGGAMDLVAGAKRVTSPWNTPLATTNPKNPKKSAPSR